MKDAVSGALRQSVIAYSPKGVTEAAGLSLRQVMKDIKSGQLRSYKKGRRRIIFRTDLEAYLRNGDTQ